MLYRPKLASGRDVQLPLLLTLFRLMNTVCWPLEDGASRWARALDRLVFVLFFAVFLQHNEAEVRYLVQNYHDLDKLLTGVPTYLVLVEAHLRVTEISLRKERFKRFLQKFYTTIYIEESSNPSMYRHIQRQLRPTAVASFTYYFTLSLYMLTPILNLVYNRREPLYKMVFLFDHTPLPVYVAVLVANMFVGAIVGSLLFGEVNFVGQISLHLSARYRLLREDLEHSVRRLLERRDRRGDPRIARDFEREVVAVLQRNVALNEFAQEFRDIFSFRLFVLFAFAAAKLCALGFKVYTNPFDSVPYMFWIWGNIIEILTFGELGSILLETTNDLSSMYYMCGWEGLVEAGSNPKDNVRLMRMLTIAIETNHRPFSLTGMNFFDVSLSSAVTILRGAGSYFTCLISFR